MLGKFNRIETLRVHGANRVMEFKWPSSKGFPSYGLVIARTELDQIALRHAENAGAQVFEGSRVNAPIVENRQVRGVVVGGTEHRAKVVVAADGATSPLMRSLGVAVLENRPFGMAVRVQAPSRRKEDGAIESYLEIRDSNGKQVPGYGWVFPMGDGLLNIGAGLLSTYKSWRSVNTYELLKALFGQLDPAWEVESLDEMRASGEVKGWRLPMAFSTKRAWVPGLVAVGDAAGVVNPFNGEGISEAVESGICAGEVLLNCDPADLSAYQETIEELWGPYYRLGRTFARLIGKPAMMRGIIQAGMHSAPLMSFAFKVLANLYEPEGGTMGDRTARAMVKLAEVIKLG